MVKMKMVKNDTIKEFSSAVHEMAPAGGVRLFRSARAAVFTVLEPLDYLSRVLNHKTHLPPLSLRRRVNGLISFETSSAEFMLCAKLIANLRPDEKVLDIGCGCGAVALRMLEHLDSRGSYLGVDPHEPSIRWCQQNITTRNNSFRFQFLDVKNGLYNANGDQLAERFVFPLEDSSFDLIILKSVFTHLRPPEVENYLKEIARMLSVKGRCLATFYLITDDRPYGVREDLKKINFQFGDANFRYQTQHCQEKMVAYGEPYLSKLISGAGLEVAATYYGNWSGCPEGLMAQDTLLLRRKA